MGMPDVEDEIFTYSKNYISTSSIYFPKILKDTPEETKVFPLVIIRQFDDTLEDEDLEKEGQKFKLEYEIEIYTIDKGSISRKTIEKELKKLVNDIFDSHYGMYRRACNPIPNIDRNVNKLYMRYNALIDANKKIYRR